MKKFLLILLLSFPAYALEPITFAERDAFWATLSKIEMCFDSEVEADGVTRVWARMHYDIRIPGTDYMWIVKRQSSRGDGI